jgi:SNF family Na+-dependent transporter
LSIFPNNPDSLAIGITVDLLLTVPFVYFLLIRKTSIPKTTVVPFLILGIIICSIILPSENQYFLNLFKIWVLPIIEISILSYVIYNVRKAIKRYKLNKNRSLDFFTALKSTCYAILPKEVVILLVTEIAVFYIGKEGS